VEIKPRFEDFNQLLLSLEHKFGETEPLLLKSNRPFLYSSEVSVVVPKTTTRRGKNGKNNKKIKDMKETYRTFTESNPVPHPMSNLKGNKVYKITSDVTGNFVTAASNGSISFLFSQLQQASQYAAVFDQYMITCIEVWIDGDPNALNTATQFISVTDYDDATTMSFTQLLPYQNALISNAGVSHYRKFVPHIAVATYSGTFVSFGNASMQWIDTVSSSVQHFGIKGAYSTGTPTVNYWARYHVSFRQSK